METIRGLCIYAGLVSVVCIAVSRHVVDYNFFLPSPLTGMVIVTLVIIRNRMVFSKISVSNACLNTKGIINSLEKMYECVNRSFTRICIACLDLDIY